MSSAPPTPATTFELRFESAMVKGDQVGLPAADSPLVIQPPLAGTFTWLSPRSGVFTPREPLALDTTYQLRLAAGLRRADGQPSAATLRWTVTTPAFGIMVTWPHRTDTNADSEPEIKLAFNADVRAADARRFIYFRDLAGNQMPADIRQGEREDLWSGYGYGAGSVHTWKQDATAMRRAGAEKSENTAPENPTNEVPNLLVATPQRALPIGKGWQLFVARGVPAADHARQLRELTTVPIGDIRPFEVEAVTANNNLNAEPAIQVVFSKPIPATLTNDFRDWIELSAVPTNLAARVQGRRLNLTGNFHGGDYFTLKLRPGFPAVEPFTLQGSNAFTLGMPHIAPRLYFPAFARDQLAEGSRTIPLLAVNVARVRVRAKLMDASTAVHALRAYGSYFATYDDRRHRGDEDEAYRAIDYNVLPGTTVFDQELALDEGSQDSDLAQKLNLNWDELLNGRRAGVVFLDAQAVNPDHDTAPGAQALIQLTDLGMVWKKSQAGVDVFVFSHRTGKPVANSTARLVSDENQTLREAVTDANGRAHLGADTNADWVAAQSGDDFHAVLLDQNRVWRYQFNLPVTGSDEPEDTRRVLLFSDRDLYRPGEDLHLEAIVRDWSDQGLSVPAGLTGTLECVDARGRSFFRTNAAFSALGSWSTLVPLPADSRGFCSAGLRLVRNRETNEYNLSFQVQEFKPSAFEILLPCQRAYAPGETVALPLSARYLFGKSLSRAQVAWSLQAEDMDFHPEKFVHFSFRRSDFESRYGRGRSALTLSGRGTLAGGTNFIIAPELSANPVAPQPRAVSLLAEVTDVNQQTLSRRIEFVRHSSDFYLGLRQGAEVLSSNTAPPLEIAALGADGKPWPETIKARLTLQRIDWQSVRVQGAGRTVRFRNEAVLTNILEAEIAVAPVAAPGAEADEATGNRIGGLPPLPAGEYLVEVTAADGGGRPVISSLNFQVSALAELSWNYRNDVQLALKPNQKAYAPGETAEILVESPFSGTALVTVEREKVLRSFVTPLDGNAPSLRVPVEAGDAPNVFVSVTLLRGADQSPHQVREPEYRIGCCELPVVNPQSRLAVEITPARTNNLPGQPVDVTVQVNDAARQPVAGAEIVLYAVDEGVLSLTAYALPDPHGFFYAARPLSVQSSISLPNLLVEDPDALRFDNKGYLGGGGGQERVRKKFLACAFWSATLPSGADGKVHARFAAPDSLTRYRLYAVAHTADSRFGSGQSAFHVAKPLILEPALPSFANITDHLLARGVVLNQTTNSGEVIVALELDDKVKSTNSTVIPTRRVFIPALGSAVVEFPVEFTDTGDSRWVWRARFADATASDFTDAVQSTISVGHIAPLLGEVLLSRAGTVPTNLLALANPQLLAGRGTVTVSVANTRLNELGETAAQLLHYPYGCAEQTGSSLLPWILLREARGLLPERAGTKTNDAVAAIRAGVARLFSMQTPSGGLGYWPRAREPMLWASAYGGMVLALAQRHGVAVPKHEFDALQKYLGQQLWSADDDAGGLSDRCLALYALALAGRAEPACQEKLFAVRATLSAEDRALLALAIAENHGPREMIAGLLQNNLPAPANGESRFGCAAREQAIRLLAWIDYRPEDPTVDRLVSDLMREQKQAHWQTTQANAWALLALTEYARRIESTRQAAEGRLQYAGQTVSFRLNDQTNVFTRSFSITNLPDTALALFNASTNLLYTTVAIAARPPETPQPRQDRGFSLERRYDRLDDDNQPQDLAGLRVGDRVLVTLRLSLRESAGYVVIDDALPSILEAVNPEFRTQEARAAGPAENENWWLSDFREIRKDRLLSFADWVPPGTYELRYVARVRAAGSVTAPPAKAEEMYHPERCGFTATQTLASEPLQ